MYKILLNALNMYKLNKNVSLFCSFYIIYFFSIISSNIVFIKCCFLTFIYVFNKVLCAFTI